MFGWDAEDMGPPGGPPAYTEWKLAGKSVGGMMLKIARHAGRHAAELGRLLRGGRHRRHAWPRRKSSAARCSWGPTDIEPGRFAVLADNVGAVFNVLQLKS